MRFARQKLLILLCFMVIPPAGFLSLLETPELSNILLRLSLRFARLRTGIKVDATGWDLSVLTFSAKLENVKVTQDKIQIEAPRLEVWVSPMSLLVGRLHLNVLEVAGARVSVDSPNFLSKNPFEKKPNEPPSKFLETGNLGDDYPKLLGTLSQDILKLLSDRNVEFDDIRISDLSFDMGALKIEGLRFLLNNLQEGQLRAEWNLDSAQAQKGTEPIERFSGSLSLLKNQGSTYQLYVGDVSLGLPGNSEPILRVRGMWPGEMVVDADLDLAQINQWISASPWFRKDAFSGTNRGKLKVSAAAQLTNTRLNEVQTELSTKDLIYSDYFLNHIESKLKLGFRDSKFFWDLNKLQIELPVVKGVLKNWKNRIDIKELQVANSNLNALVNLDEASLCGILIAASEVECQVGVAFTGPLRIEGSLDPMRLRLTPDFRITAGPVMSDPYVVAGSEPVLQLKPGRMSGSALAREKDLVFERIKLLWQDKHELNVEGNLAYKPTKLHLKVKGKEARLDEIMSDLVGLRFGGATNVEGDIYYDYSLERSKRTRIEAQLRSGAFQFEAQEFGSLAGPLRYEDKILFLGPFQLRSGGGTALVQGSLSPNDERGSYLTLVAQTNRFEFAAYTDEARKSEAFRGFLSGRATLNGFVDATRHPENGLRGDMNFRARNFKAFEIPFSEAELQGLYEKGDLKVQRLIARKDGARLSLKGLLSPKGGSEITFESEPIPLRNIDIEPKLAIFERGLVEIEGYWRPNEGWGVKGQVQGAAVAGQSLGSGSVNLIGTEKAFEMDLKFGDLLDVGYRGIYRKDELLIDTLEARMKDAGIYAGLAYLGDWKRPMPVDTSGFLGFQWRPREGYFETRDLKVSAPHLSESRREVVLDVPASQKLSWGPSGVTSDTIDWVGPAKLQTTSTLGADTLAFTSDLPLGLVHLFLPAVDIRAGRAQLTATVPLSPHFATLRMQGKVENGILKIPGIAGSLDEVEMDIEMQRSQLDIRKASMRAGSGTARVSGVYRVDFDKPAADLRMDLDGAQIVLMNDVPATVNGELQIRGEKLPYLMNGRVVVNEALYGKEFDEAPEESEELSTDPSLNFDLDVELGPGSRVRNSTIAADARGRIKLTGSDVAPIISGDMVLSNGAIFANQTEFAILQSRIQFLGNADNVPLVNVRANTTARYSNVDYKIELNARGPSDSLAIEFSSDPPISNQDIVSLLAFGVIRQDDPVAGDDLASAAQAEAFQAIFGRAIGNSLSKSTGFDVRLKAATSTAGKADNVPKVSVMRRLSERVTARFARSLDMTNPEKDVQVDYRLLNNVNLSGVWESPTPEESSVGVDLRFRFEVE